MRRFAAQVGDLARYAEGPTALMRVTQITGGRYYGRAFHSVGTCTSRHEVWEPDEADRARWAHCHGDDDAWIRGRFGDTTSTPAPGAA